MIAIVGAGKVGRDLLFLFNRSSLTQVAYIVDTNLNTPGMLAARENHIPTYTDMDRALASQPGLPIFNCIGTVIQAGTP